MKKVIHPTSEEFLHILELAIKELEHAELSVTEAWVKALYDEAKLLHDDDETLSTSRLALSLIQAVAALERKFVREKGIQDNPSAS